jgi:23S rRNA (pseudouridine1915-N3)-methyltransferase
MKNFRFVFVGQAKNSSYKELENEYFTKVSRYVRGSQLLHVKDGNDKNTTVRNDKEGQAFLVQVPANAHLVLCDESGKSFDSPTFAKKLDQLLNERDVVVFGVGGAYGFSDAVKARSTLTLRLAPWTLPHELARVVLLEQVYRAQTILRGEKYHHD